MFCVYVCIHTSNRLLFTFWKEGDTVINDNTDKNRGYHVVKGHRISVNRRKTFRRSIIHCGDREQYIVYMTIAKRRDFKYFHP